MRKILALLSLSIVLSPISFIKVEAQTNLSTKVISSDRSKSSQIVPSVAPSNLWVRHSVSASNSSSNIISSGVIVDNLGNEYVTGYFNASADFGTGNIAINASGNDHNDFFILKYDSNGTIQWVKHSVSNTSTIRSYGIVSDTAGNIYITGLFDGKIDLGTGSITANGINDFFIAKFNAAGVAQWVQHSVSNSPSSGSIYSKSISIDATGNLYITGNYQSTADFGTGSTTPNGANDFFVVRFSNAGVAQWTQHSIANTSNTYPEKIAVDSQGNSYITGHFGAGSINFGTGNISANASQFHEDFFIAKFNITGVIQWVKHSINNSGSIYSQSVAIDNTDNPYITGDFLNGTADFGTGPISATGNDYFVVKYDINGNVQFVKSSLADSGTIHSKDIKFDGLNNFYLAGYFSGTVDLGTGAITNPSPSRQDFFIAKFNSLGLNLWVQHSIEDNFYIYSTGLAVDTTGNVYLTGGFGDSVNLGTGIIAPNGTTDFFFAKYNLTSPFVQSIEHTRSNTLNTVVLSVVVDASKNKYTSGYLTGTADFGKGKITANGSQDYYVAKYDSVGTIQWINHSISNSLTSYSTNIAVDNNGNSYITGNFVGTVNFGTGTIKSNGARDYFIAKYNSLGVIQWVQHSNSTKGSLDSKSLIVDNSGNSYLLGNFRGMVDFGKGKITANGSQDYYVAKYNTSGIIQWVDHSISNASTINTSSIKLDNNGDLYITGSFFGNVNFGTSIITPKGLEDLFLVKLNSNGSTKWVQHSISNNGNLFSKNLAIDNNGDLYVTGYFRGVADFGKGTLTAKGGYDYFIAKYNTDGIVQWSKSSVANRNKVFANSIGVDKAGNTYMAGYFRGTTDFGTGSIVANGPQDFFIVKYNSSGIPTKVQHSSSNDSNIFLMSLAIDNAGNIYTGGYFEKNVNFGTGLVKANGNIDFYINSMPSL